MRTLFFIAVMALFYQHVQAQCPTSITVSETSPCGLEPVTFSANPVTPGYTYSWNFGDPQAEDNNDTGINDNMASGAYAAHAFTANSSATEYTVTLQAVDENGDTCAAVTQVIDVQPAPSAVLNGEFQQCSTDGPMSVFNLMIVDGGSTSDADAYTIDWGDGSPPWTSDAPPPNTILTHEYPLGLFYLEYTVTDNSFSGCPSSTATYLIYNGTNPNLGVQNSGNTTICLPDDIDFVITNTDLNTPGTMYFITINDGTDTITYTQNTLPDTVNHVFNEISCGTDAGDFVDAFEFVIRAINPCDEKEAAIRPIRVGRRPTAEMSITPEPPQCDTTIFTLVNETMDGVEFDNGMCIDKINTQWIITALDGGGHTFVSGNALADSIEVQFTAGDYQVDLVVSNDCGPDTATQFICIQPTPEADFTCSTLTGCTPLEVTVDNLSNTFINMSNCSNVQYSWDVGHSDTSCDPPSSGTFDYINGTNANSPEPEIQFEDPGEYVLTLTVRNECGEQTHQQTIIVADGPNGQIAPVEEVYCGSATVSFSMENVSDCNDTPTFEWSFPGATPSSFSGANPTNIFFPDEGNYQVSVTITNSCGSSEATLPFTVLEGPEAMAALDYNQDETCIPVEVSTVNNSMGDNLSFEWSVAPSTGWSFVDNTDLNTPNPTFEFTEAGEYTIMLTASSDCGNDIWTESITVTDQPQVELDDVPDEFCETASIQPLAIYGQPGLVDEVVWSFPDGEPSSFNGLQLDGPVLYNEPGTYTFTVTASNECGSVSDNHTFTIIQGPGLDITVDTNFACIGEQITVTNNSVGDNLTYEWTQISGPGTINFVAPTSAEPMIDLSDATPGSYTYSVAIGNEVCGTITQNFDLQISEPPQVELAELDDYCEIAELQLMPTYPNQNLVDSVFWQFPAGAMPVETSNDFDPGAITVEGAGDYTVNVSVFNACGEDSAEQAFTILEGPDLDIALSADFICAGGSITTANSSTGDNLQYGWSYDGPGSISISDEAAAAPTFDFTGTEPGLYTITVEVGNDACAPITQNFEVEVSEAPMVELAELDVYCETAELQLMPTYPNQGLVDSVFWQFPAGETSNGFDPGTVTVEGAGDYTVSVSVFNACGEDSAEQAFTILEGPDLDIALSADFICAGGSITTANNSAGDNLQYGWSYDGPGSISISDEAAAAPAFDFAGTAPGLYTITVEVGNDACAPITQNFEVEVSEAPMVELAELDVYCETAELQLMPTYPNQNLVDSVFWQFPAGAMPVETSNDFDPGAITVEGAGDYTVNVSVFNACGEDSAEQAFTILEGSDLDIALSADFICAGGSITTANNSAGDNLQYGWSYAGPGSISISDEADPAPTFDFTGTAPGLYTITVEVGNDACAPITQNFEVEVSEAPMVELAELDVYCETAELQLMPTYPNQGLVDSVFWQFPAGETSNGFDPGTVTVEGAGDYMVSVSVFNACGEDSAEQAFSILEGPVLDLSVQVDTLCTASSLMVENNSSGDQLTYFWSYEGEGEVQFNDVASPAPEITFPDTGLFVLNVLVGNPVCDPVSWSDTVLVLETPTVSFPEIPDDCGETTIDLDSGSITLNNPGRLDSIRWTFPGGQPETSTDLFPGTVYYGGAGSYTVTATVYNFCGTNTISQSFDVLEPIQVDAQLSEDFSCEMPFTVEVDNLSSGDQLSFEWSVTGPFAGDVAFDPLVAEPSFVFQDTGQYVITQTVFNDICGELTWSDTVTLLALPNPILTPAEDFCESAALVPEVDYQGYRVDSVLWMFPGGMPESSTQLFPDGVTYSGAGAYSYTLTAYNACGSTEVLDEFVIDTIPMVDLGPTDTICITDGLYNLPTPSPAGGVWQDSLGQPGIVTEDGVFDPEAAGGGITALEYVFNVGACEISTYKQVLVIDLSSVDGGAPVDACISLDTLQLTGASPAGGWYEGSGVIDSTGLFAPSSLEEGCYTLTYFFQLPGTDCVQGDELTVCVRPLPVPDLSAIDSLCVDVPTPLLHQSQNAVEFGWSINDSLLYEVETPVHTFADTGTHLIRLDAISEYGCVDSASTEVYVSGPPVTQFEMDTTMGCAVLPITFTNSTIGYEFASYDWDFGNGTVSTEEQPGTINYEQGLQDTTYSITLHAENHCGETEFADSVLVLPSPLANFQASQYAGCSPLDVAINNTTQGLPESFLWEIISTDGYAVSYTDSIPPDQVFLAPDSTNVVYNIRLYAFNECGTDTLDRQVLVKPNQIRAFFSVPDNEGCEPYTVDFLNTTSPDSALVYNWYFGDGNTSNQTDTTYTYTAIGDTTTNYSVTLVADNGCARDSAFGEVTVFPAPKVSFEAAPYACLEDSAFFQNTSVDVNGTLWDFGDGNTATSYDAYHAYDATGPYTITLTAYAAITGCPNTFNSDIEVRPLPNPAFTPDATFGCPPLQVGVDNTTTDASYFVWHFGDGNTAVGENPPAHTYQSPGFYDIRLEATDLFGCSDDTVFSFINVYPVPDINFEAVPDEPCGLPHQVCITNQTTNASGFSWSFGNGSTSQENAPCTVYNEAGTYTISLTAQNEFLCTESATQDYTVYGVPFANFSPMDTTGCEPFWLTMDNQSEFVEYALWQFGAEAWDSTWHGSHVFRDTGWYDISLTVGNGSGCADTLKLPDVVYVQGSPQAGFAYDRLDNELGSTYQFFNDSSSDVVAFDWDFGDGAASSQENPVHRYLSSFDKEVRQIVFNEAGCPDTAYTLIDLDTLSGLFIPNVLEPATGTTLEKQIFLPKGIGLSEYEIAVYARNGQLVWSSTALDEEGRPTESWDGTLNGQDLPAGVFVWKVHKARFFNNTPWDGMPDEEGKPRRSGFLYLVR